MTPEQLHYVRGPVGTNSRQRQQHLFYRIVIVTLRVEQRFQL